MKKKFYLLLIGTTLSLTGCDSSVSFEKYSTTVEELEILQEKYDDKIAELGNMQEKYDTQTKELNSVKEKLKKVQTEAETVKEQLTKLQDELNSIKENTIEAETESADMQEETNISLSDTSKYVESSIKSAANKVFGYSNVDSINYVSDTEFVLIKARGKENLSNKMTVQGMYKSIFDTLKELKDIENLSIDFNIIYPLTDKYGNTSDEIVIKASYSNQTRQKINFDNISFNNIDTIADEWWMHAALEAALQQ